MKKIFTLIKGLFTKGVALLLLSVLTIFTLIFNVFLLIYRLLSAFFAVAGTILIGAEYITTGFTSDMGYAIVFIICIVVLYFTLPLLAPVLKKWNKKLKNHIYAPLFKAPPVRYTI